MFIGIQLSITGQESTISLHEKKHDRCKKQECRGALIRGNAARHRRGGVANQDTPEKFRNYSKKTPIGVV